MRHIEDPRQHRLFDPFANVFSDLARRRVETQWYGVFRHVILDALDRPVVALATHFCPDNGTPTKELYSMAGLLLIKEFMGWTAEQAADAYMFHAAVQYALNLEPSGQEMCRRTIQRYEKLFVDDEIAAVVMSEVTARLRDELDVRVERQRLDSTHVFSNMATFARTRLMGVTIKRFLTQVKRHDALAYAALPPALRERYEPSQGQLFGYANTKEARRRLRQEVAEDMCYLVERFAADPTMRGRKTYKDLVRVFEQQCEVKREKVEVEGEDPGPPSVTVRDKTGGDVIQNPSDPEATLDGHKGPGYKVQLSETCSPDNPVQLIVAAIPQTAVEADGPSLEPVVEALEDEGATPKELLADGAYGSDENAQTCADRGIALVSPASSGVPKDTEPKADRLAEFELDPETGEVSRCPAGHAPLHSSYDAKKETVHLSMAGAVCESCPDRATCPVQRRRKRYVAHFTRKRWRLSLRRRNEQTDEFGHRYRLRGGIESTNSGLKRRVGLGRLRVRGAARVFHAIRMKCAGWNILRAASVATLPKKAAAVLAHARTARRFDAIARCLTHLSALFLPPRLCSAPTTRRSLHWISCHPE